MTGQATAQRQLEAALKYAELGFPVLPLHSANGNACSCDKTECSSPAKHPRTAHGLKDASTDPAIVRRWFEKWPDANIGIRTGPESGILALDIDPRNGGDESLKRLEREFVPLPLTVEAETGGGGRHFLFRHPGVQIRCRSGLRDGIDIKGDNGYIVAPPSGHISGKKYSFKEGHSPLERPRAELPEWLLRILVPGPQQGECENETNVGGQIHDGFRNSRLTSLAGTMRRKGATQRTIEAALLEENRTRCRPPLAEAEVGQIAASVSRYTPAEASNQSANVVKSIEPIPLAEHLIDHRFRDGSGRLLLRRYQGEFFAHNKACYRRVTEEELDARIYTHLEGLRTAKLQDEVVRLVKVVPRSRLVREVRLALPSRGLLLPNEVFPPIWLDERESPDPLELIPCANGILDLTMGKLIPATPFLFQTYALAFSYDSNAPVPVEWLKFLESLWGDEPDAISSLQEIVGYLLSPDISRHKIFLLSGPRRSGKGTIARVLKVLLGEQNVCGPTLESLAGPFGLQTLIGRTLAIISDARVGRRSDQSTVVERLLAISGGDHLSVPRKHLIDWNGLLLARFLILTNELPMLADASGALASRFHVLMLRKSFLGKEDFELQGRLYKELPGILNWAIEGRRRLREQRGFTKPVAFQEAIMELEALGSPIRAFVEECCVLGPTHSTPAADLYESWGLWCARNGRRDPGTRQLFGRDLRAAFPELKSRRTHGTGKSRPTEYDGIGRR